MNNSIIAQESILAQELFLKTIIQKLQNLGNEALVLLLIIMSIIIAQCFPAICTPFHNKKQYKKIKDILMTTKNNTLAEDI